MAQPAPPPNDCRSEVYTYTKPKKNNIFSISKGYRSGSQLFSSESGSLLYPDQIPKNVNPHSIGERGGQIPRKFRKSVCTLITLFCHKANIPVLYCLSNDKGLKFQFKKNLKK